MHPSESLDTALGSAVKPGNDVQGGTGMQGRDNMVRKKGTWHGGWTWYAAGRGKRM